jgi:hypothetical protein
MAAKELSLFSYEPKRLARLGYLAAHKEPGKRASAPSTRSPTMASRRCATTPAPRSASPG